MPLTPEPLPSSVRLLQAQVDLLQQQLGETQQALAAAQRENTLLRQKVDALARRCFGKQSEQLSSAQRELLLAGLTNPSVALTPPAAVPARPAPPPPRGGWRAPDPHARPLIGGAHGTYPGVRAGRARPMAVH